MLVAGAIQPLGYVFIIFLVLVLLGDRIRQRDKDDFYRKHKDK